MKDFFISHNKADSNWAQWVAWQLEEVGFSVIIQEWDYRPGSNFILEMDKASQKALKTIAILSPDYLNAESVKAEWTAAFQRDPTGEHSVLIPVRVKLCDLKGLFSSIIYIDLVDLDQMSAQKELLQGIQPSRAKPSIAPTFPGSNQPPSFPGSGRQKTSSKLTKNSENRLDIPHTTTHQVASASHEDRSTDFVIITALQEELEAVLNKLPSPQRLPPHDEDVRIYYKANLPVTFSDGTKDTYQLVLMSLLGMGRVQAANATNDAIRRWHPRYILFVGIAGGVAEANVKRGDVLVSDQIVDYELQKLTETGPQVRWDVHQVDPRLLQAARNLGNNWRKLIKKRRPQKGMAECLIGLIATGDKVIAIKEAIEHLRKDWPKLIGIEMEAGGVASAAFQSARQPGFFMIRGVSDLADENKDDTWRLYACHSAAAYAIALLQNGPVTPSKPEKASNRDTETISSEKQITNSLPFIKPIHPEPLELKIPEMGKYFLSRQDREYLINIIDTTVNSIPAVDGVKNLLRDKLPLAQINRINYRNGSRNIAEEIMGNLEPRGALNPPYYHALGAFLKDLIEDDLVSYDATAHIVALLFGYTLVKDRKQIEKLSTQFQVPSPRLTEELLINHPYSLASLSRNIKTKNLQERLESLYNRRRYLLDVKFLSQGAKAANAVCRIDFDKRGEGTGFLVAPDLILTNYHVMLPPGYKGDSNARARKCEIKFGVIEGLSAGTRFTLDNNKWLIEQSRPEDLDFMLLRLNRPVTANDQVWPLSLEPNSIQLDEFVNIIQHPNGGSMEVSIRFNQVVAVEDNRIYYLADTEEGSSGSPVFNDSWELVALHHSGGKLDGSGNLTVAANIGVPINAIREKIAVYLNK